MDFTSTLLQWHSGYTERPMPWKGEKDPYKIWLSEIILQQTRVAQGWNYYEKFISRYPDIHALASANDDEVFKLWEGLGYYTRCKNLLLSARRIAGDMDGKFPETYESILQLKGVGPYTAAAIASFAFGLPYAVVDGNVFRVLARFFGEYLPIDTTQGKIRFTQLAVSLLDKKNSAAYNQAIMDFGATICKPQVAQCSKCVLNRGCIAFAQGSVNKLPIKEKRLTRSVRWFYYFIFHYKAEVLISQRLAKDIWHGLFEFYLVEMEHVELWQSEKLNEWMKNQIGSTSYELLFISTDYRQQLTHQVVNTRFISLRLAEIPESLQHLKRVKSIQIRNFAFPKSITMYLEAQAIQQQLF